MARSEDVKAIIRRFDEGRPDLFFKKVDETNVGIDCMLRLLDEAGREVSSGEITELMNVSSARVAVLVKKTAERGLIVKESDPGDARRARIRLSERGEDYVAEMRESIESLIGAVIDRVGMERLGEFFTIADEIKDIIIEKTE